MSSIGLPDIVAEVAKTTGQPQQVVGKVLTSFLLQIEAARWREDEPQVRIKGFGKFWFSLTKERVGRNPSTGKEMVVPAMRRLRFSPSRSLLERIKDKKPVVVALKKRAKSVPRSQEPQKSC